MGDPTYEFDLLKAAVAGNVESSEYGLTAWITTVGLL